MKRQRTIRDKAAEFIGTGKGVETVRTELFNQITANSQDIDNTLTPDQQNKAQKPLIDTQAIYQKRNIGVEAAS